MKFPEGFEIVGKSLTLIPYKPAHVPKYHSWMGDDDILRLTGSERLSLEEEYEMQQDWERDTQKCTFIIVDHEKLGSTSDEMESIVGDTNLFFQPDEPCSAEIEVMIAEQWARRRGLAKEALELTMNYGQGQLGKSKFIAKIKQDNLPSIHMFSKLGFIKVSESQVFNEFTFELNLN